MRINALIIIFIVLLNISLSFPFFAFALDVNPNIETISTGPFSWKDGKTGVRLRVIVVLSEVHLNLFIQRIEYGEENCCARVTKTYEIDSEKLEGKYQLYSVTDIRWIGYDTLQFKGNATGYVIKNLDGKYEIIRQTMK